MKKGIIIFLSICLIWSIVSHVGLEDQVDHLQRNISIMEKTLANRDLLIERSNELLNDQNEVIVKQEAAITVLKDTVAQQSGAIAIMEAEGKRKDATIEGLQVEIDELDFKLGEDLPVLPRINSPFSFDCDDSTLYMFHFFTARGYDIKIVSGNLEMDNESFFDCNHVWLWVEGDNGATYPYDWGVYMPDKQHCYGYPITYSRLLREALRDQKNEE